MQLLDIAFRLKPRAPMQTQTDAMVTKLNGVTGDARGKPGKRQVTVLSQVQWQQACQQINTMLPWTYRRANLLVDEVEFHSGLVGQQIRIGQLLMLITGETDPCPKMDAQHWGLTQALEPDWRGGVCCQILTDGRVKVGDLVEIGHSLHLK